MVRLEDIAGLAESAERFWSQVDKSGDCWEWQGLKKTGGYAMFKVRPRAWPYNGARSAYLLTYGEIPDGAFVCHRCDNPDCVRPDHLYIGSATTNNRDTVERNRRNNPVGERHPNTKVSMQDVQDIRRRFQQGERRNDLAREYGVSATSICRYINATTWRASLDYIPHEAHTAPRGTEQAAAKLTDDAVRAIRLRYAAGGVRYRDLAETYGVSTTVIEKVVRRLTWKHVA